MKEDQRPSPPSPLPVGKASRSLGIGWVFRFISELFAFGRAAERRRQEQLERIRRMTATTESEANRHDHQP